MEAIANISRIRQHVALLVTLWAAWVSGCSHNPSVSPFEGGPGSEVDYPVDSTGGETDSARDDGGDTGEDTEKPKPLVWMVPPDREDELPCANGLIPFDFSPQQLDFSLRNSFWMMWASYRSFFSDKEETAREFASLGFSRYRDFDKSLTGLQAFIAGGDDAIILSFRGSIELVDWFQDLDITLKDGDAVGQPGKVHRGIARVLEGSWGEIESTLAEFAADGQIIWITGHSLGGALANLAASRLVTRGYSVGPLYTFATPRVGNREYAEATWELLQHRHYRLVNGRDIVPRFPPSKEATLYAVDLFPEGLVHVALEELFSRFDYTHSGILLLMGAGGELRQFPAFDDQEDIFYWSGLAEEADEQGIFDLIKTMEQDILHNEHSYMCRLKELYFGASRRSH